jgi:cysteine-rich repeat protein
VTPGPYLLKIQLVGSTTPTFYYTDDHVLDLGYGTAGMPGRADTTMLSTINPTITGLDRAYSSDVFSLHSLGTGTQNDHINFGTGTPIGPVPSLTASFDWRSGYGSDAPNYRAKLLANDDLQILHTRETFTLSQQQSTVVGRLVEIARIAGLTQTDGAALAVNGAFTDVATSQTLEVDIPLPQLRSPFGAVYARELVVAGLAVAAGANPESTFGPDLTYVSVNDVKSSASTVTYSLGYGNPYDATWPTVAYELYQRQRRVRVPGVIQNQPANVILTNLVSSHPNTGPLTGAIQVAPPTGIQIDGTVANDGVRTFGAAPVRVSWNAVSAANRYTVAVLQLSTQPSSRPPATIANAVTTEASIALPAELFTLGQRYIFVVGSVRDAVPYASGALRASAATSASSQAATGVIFLSNTCGNGAVDAGEECDTSGESATCDVDCSFPVCLDGLVNTAAQEMCDAGMLTGGCDDDCTPQRCGDGYVNPFAGEQCDDNNTDPDDGCSPQCQFDNSCGDGIRQPLYGEQCDDGDVDNTNACVGCQNARCGDGFTHAGVEQCDDGNAVAGDGCSPTCTTET